MPLPEGFNEFEHLQDLIRREHNKFVREYFKNELDDDISTPRASLKHACLIKDEDTAAMTEMRQWLFEITCRHAQSLQPAIYGIPVSTYHDSIAFYPQVMLYFLEDLQNVEEGHQPVDAEISFRLMHETSATYTPVKAKALATRIKSALSSGNGFVWKKGREKWIYQDNSKGYDFRLLAWNEAEAKKVIEQVLDIQSHSPDWNLLSVATKKKQYTTVPGTHEVYGKSRRKPRDRPIAFVRFRYAELKLHGLFNDITLIDRTGFRSNPIIPAR